MDMPFINDVWGEEDMFAIEGGITSGLSSPVLSSPSSPIRHLAVTKGGSSPYPPSSSAFASACIAVGSMDDPSSSTSPVSASPPASPSLVKRPLFVGSSTDANGFQVTTHVHEAVSAHDPKSDAMLDGPVVVEMDYMEEEQGEEENGIGDSKRLHGDKARQKGESEAGAAKSEPAAKNARRTTNEAGDGEGKASEDAQLGASKKGAESMEVDDISRELTTATSDDGHDHQHLSSSSSAPISVPPLDAHSTTTGVRSTTVDKVEARQPQIETGETPAETTLLSVHQLGATVLPPPPALPLAPQLLTTASTTPPATTSAPQVPTAAPPLAEPVAAPATPTATRSKTSAATASTKKSPTTPKAPVSKTVTLRVNTDREDFKRFASMTRDKLRQELKVRGLSVSGTKTDLYQRIVEAILVQEQRDKGVVGVVSNVKVGKVTAKGVGVKGRGKGRKQSRPGTAADEDEDEDDIETGKGKKSAGFAFPVPSASASGSSSAPFTPFSPFAPPVSSGFAVPLSQGQAVMARKEAADSDLLSLDFSDEDALDIPLEESLMEELRKQEEREQKMGMGMAVGDDAEYRYRNEEERDDEDDSDSSDDMSSQDDEEEEDDLADDEERAVGGGGKIGGRSAVVRRSHRSHHAPKDELGETAMRRKENEEGLQEASKLTDIVLVNDKIPKHLRTDDRYYYCKHCDRAWPKTSFRNAQQFGAHCSNCARRQIRRTPSLPGTRTLGSPVVPAVDSLRRLSVGRLPQRRPDDASPSLKSSRDLSNSGTRKLAKNSIQPMTLGRMKAENRGVFLWFDALPTDLIVRILSFLESSPRDLGAISASCHFFSIIAANDALWRRMFEARWGTDLASRYSGTWRERFASRVSFLKVKATLPPALPSPTAVANVSDEEAGKLKEAWNGLLADPKLKARTVEAVLAVSQAEADATNAGAPAPAGSAHYLVQWAPADDNDSSAPEERQRWVSEETMTVAPVVTLAGCSSALLGSRKRRASDYALSRDGSSKRLRRPGGSDDDSSDSDDDGVAGFGDLNDLDRKRKRRLLEDESDDDDVDDRSDDDSLLGEDSLDGLTNPMAAAAADAQQQLLRRKFEEGPGAKEARLKRKQLLREKEERARKRRRKGRRGGQDGAGGADDASMNGANNDDVPLTKEDKERQQREFLRVLYNNRDYKPVILFFDRNA